MNSSSQVAHHSDLEVVQPYIVPEAKYGHAYGYANDQLHHEPEVQPAAGRNFWGLQPTVFWLLVALGFVLLAAGIGGGVGGGLVKISGGVICSDCVHS